MPEKILTSLLQTPSCDLRTFCLQRGHASVYFVIDSGRYPNALARLYQLGLPFEPTPLLLGTDLDVLAAQGPFGFEAQTCSELGRAAARLCLSNQCGIVLAGAKGDALQLHARSLLKVNDGSGGQSLLSLGSPPLWAALAITSGTAAPRLYGPALDVFSPAPRQLDVAADGWYHWKAPASRDSAVLMEGLLDLDPMFARTAKTLQSLYWVDKQHLAFDSPNKAELPTLLSNLNTLINHGITEGRHLLRLARVAKGPDLTDNTQAVSILQARDDDFMKVEQLIQLVGNCGQ